VNIDREDVCDMTLTEANVKAFDTAIDQQVDMPVSVVLPVICHLSV
jgi:hypothetical protein